MIPTRPLRRPRVLIVGCGDVGMRTVALLAPRFTVLALNRREAGRQRLHAAGVIPVPGDLDDRRSLRRAAALARAAFGVLHFAPPPAEGRTDQRTRVLIAALGGAGSAVRHRPAPPERAAIVPDAGGPARRSRTLAPGARGVWIGKPPRASQPLVYASTTGVYGDCGGALIDETRRVRPSNPRAVRRVGAEHLLRAAGTRGTFAASILRIPGIYARERLPDARLHRGTPALRAEEDVFTSHIHADDLAAIAVRALWRGRPQRLYHATDDSRLRMGDYFDRVADALGLPRPPRISREEAEQVLEPMLMSFMRESRRLDNRRLTGELAYRLRFPTVDAFLANGLAPNPAKGTAGQAESPAGPGR
ncbi:SDR family NAD(P)-dependent oxidoreductase [Robbsia sp. Bb-Pol-6]|uniref:SDR family NAD(P)-dependent oxidoreductase n=1 Tax=Robbsia betulipollinis TaxID=2981849 RepID=A0ABT3ZRA7_9BURK|nr:NAD-dependent epimerase/dehydratase family protein [Robbsia betulipollinis]MCY0388755.1 SDR family NAD(P)-dependent oxidoreductase [Robbsia betulipollinis]